MLIRAGQFTVTALLAVVAAMMIVPGLDTVRSLAGGMAVRADEIQGALVVPYVLAMLVTFAGVGIMVRGAPSRWLESGAAIGFMLASLCCAEVQVVDGIAACRALQGAFGGVLIASAAAAPFQRFAGVGRFLSAALLVAFLKTGLVVEPVATGLIVDNFGVSVVFLMAAATTALLAVAGDLFARTRVAAPVMGFAPNTRFAEEAVSTMITFATAAGAVVLAVAVSVSGVYPVVQLDTSALFLAIYLILPFAAVLIALLYGSDRLLWLCFAAALAGYWVATRAFIGHAWPLQSLAAVAVTFQIALSCTLVLALGKVATAYLQAAASRVALYVVLGGLVGAWSSTMLLQVRQEVYQRRMEKSLAAAVPGRTQQALRGLDPGIAAAAVRRQSTIRAADDVTWEAAVWFALATLFSLFAIARRPSRYSTDPQHWPTEELLWPQK